MHRYKQYDEGYASKYQIVLYLLTEELNINRNYIFNKMLYFYS